MAKLFTDLNSEEESPFKQIYEWEAPERQWSPKSKGWYVVYSLFFVSIIFIAALLREYIFIIAVIAFAFLWFIQGTIAPQFTKYSITSMGIRAFEKLYKWQNINHFWFSKKGDTTFLNLEFAEDENPNFTKRIPLIIESDSSQKIFDILIKFIDYGDKEEISFSFLTLFLSGKYLDISEYMAPESKEENKL